MPASLEDGAGCFFLGMLVAVACVGIGPEATMFCRFRSFVRVSVGDVFVVVVALVSGCVTSSHKNGLGDE